MAGCSAVCPGSVGFGRSRQSSRRIGGFCVLVIGAMSLCLLFSVHAVAKSVRIMKAARVFVARSGPRLFAQNVAGIVVGDETALECFRERRLYALCLVKPHLLEVGRKPSAREHSIGSHNFDDRCCVGFRWHLK